MSKFTKSAPFESENVFVWRGVTGEVAIEDRAAPRFFDLAPTSRTARVLHAFIEAEKNEWRKDGERFRKGRWTMRNDDTVWVLHHDDFLVPTTVGISMYWTGRHDDERISQVTERMFADFFVWHATTYPPAPVEPTRSGYVGTLLSEYGTNHHVYRYLGDDGHAYRIVGLTGGSEAHGLSWGVVLQAGTFTAATK